MWWTRIWWCRSHVARTKSSNQTRNVNVKLSCTSQSSPPLVSVHKSVFGPKLSIHGTSQLTTLHILYAQVSIRGEKNSLTQSCLFRFAKLAISFQPSHCIIQWTKSYSTFWHILAKLGQMALFETRIKYTLFYYYLEWKLFLNNILPYTYSYWILTNYTPLFICWNKNYYCTKVS